MIAFIQDHEGMGDAGSYLQYLEKQAPLGALLLLLDFGQRIDGRIIENMTCTRCKSVFDGVIEGNSGIGGPLCPVFYYVECPICSHMHNFAKMSGVGCACHPLNKT